MCVCEGVYVEKFINIFHRHRHHITSHRWYPIIDYYWILFSLIDEPFSIVVVVVVDDGINNTWRKKKKDIDDDNNNLLHEPKKKTD